MLRQLFIGLLFIGCNTKADVKVAIAESTSIDSVKHIPVPPIPKGLQVSAFLIYEDGSISSFDILNDKKKTLWNTIIGEGDAEKSSTSIRIQLNGQLEGLRVQIWNGMEKLEDQVLPKLNGDFEFVVRDTGCELVKVMITKNDKLVFQDIIEFHCGE